jgi:hypothetical protein
LIKVSAGETFFPFEQNVIRRKWITRSVGETFFSFRTKCHWDTFDQGFSWRNLPPFEQTSFEESGLEREKAMAAKREKSAGKASMDFKYTKCAFG